MVENATSRRARRRDSLATASDTDPNRFWMYLSLRRHAVVILLSTGVAQRETVPTTERGDGRPRHSLFQAAFIISKPRRGLFHSR